VSVSVFTERPSTPASRRWLAALLVLALALRLIYALSQDQTAPYTQGGGDTSWYLTTGHELVHGQDRAPLSTGPVYLLLIGGWQAVFGRTAAAIVAIRLTQVGLATLTVYFGARLAQALARDRRTGLLAAAVLAISPVFVLETAQILTETLYVFLIAGGLWLYTGGTPDSEQRAGQRLAWAAAVGIVFGAAALTRAVVLLFPLGLAFHLGLRHGWRRGVLLAAALLIAFAATVSTWTIYNLAKWDRLVIGADGFASFLYTGARGWEGPQALDQALNEDVPELSEAEATSPNRADAFLTAARRTITRDPLGYVQRRVSELANAYLQPHGTVLFGGASLKDSARDWITGDRSLDGLIDLTVHDAFWPKLALYIFHFAGLILGALGMWLTRANWRVALPLLGFILYTTLVHLVLLATPRYIFPVELFWWVFAAAALIAIRDAWKARRTPAQVVVRSTRIAE